MKAKHGSGSRGTSRRSHRASTAESAGPQSMNAIQLLKREHAEVKQLFDRFEKLVEKGSRDEKEDIVREACAKLTAHATVEEEIFYPAAREAPEADALLNEAEVEHGTAKELIAKLDALNVEDEMFDANFAVLSEYIKHHVKEEEGELFPKVQKSKLDLDALGEQMMARKEELAAELVPA
jgi:hemerythrin-like domain-containing protein